MHVMDLTDLLANAFSSPLGEFNEFNFESGAADSDVDQTISGSVITVSTYERSGSNKGGRNNIDEEASESIEVTRVESDDVEDDEQHVHDDVDGESTWS